MRLYQDLAWVWSVMTPEDTYQEEADNLWQIMCGALGKEPTNILELGAGGGYIASCLPKYTDIVLVDFAPAMLAESRKRNPTRKHICADMRTIDCGEKFDCVLIHDAVMYLHSADDVQAVLQNIKRHLQPNGIAILIPDAVQESFYEREFLAKAEGTNQGQEVSLRLTEWHWDRDVADEKVQVEFSLLIRQNGKVSCVHESHDMLLLSLSRWFLLFEETGFQNEFPNPPWFGGGEFFLLSQK